MSGKTARETFGLVAVVLSLVFVGLEIRQNNRIAMAQARQNLTDTYLEWQLAMFTNPELTVAFHTRWGLSSTDPPTPQYAMFAQLRMLENVYLQIAEGVADESALQSYGWVDRPGFRTEEFSSWWSGVRSRFHPGFLATFEAEYGLGP